MSPTPDARASDRLLADNRKASHDYHFLEVFEAGEQVVTGTSSDQNGTTNLGGPGAFPGGGQVIRGDAGPAVPSRSKVTIERPGPGVTPR